MQNYFNKAMEFLQSTLYSCKNIDKVEKKYRFGHSLRVAAIAKTIAAAEGQDVFIATLAGILHDAGKFEAENNIDHGRVSAKVAAPFLSTLDITQKQREDILFCIAVHVDGRAGYDYQPILEANTVSDADNIDRFGTYRIYQSLSWNQIEQKEANENIKNYQTAIEKIKKLKETYILSTATANKMFSKNLQRQIDFYTDLVDEHNLANLIKE